MKKFFKIIIFLILSVSSFAEWKFDKNYDMIFTNSIKSEPSQKGTLYILTEEYPTFTEETAEDKTLQKTEVKLVTEHPIEFERIGVVNIYKPNEIFILLIDNEMEIFEKSKILKVIYKDKNLSSCCIDFDIRELEKAIKEIKTKKL